MKEINLLLVLCAFVLLACGQNSKMKTANSKVMPASTFQVKQYLNDTSMIAILPIDTGYYRLFKNTMTFQLTGKDLQTVDSILSKCVKNHNNKQDTANQIHEYIDLAKYRRQYIAFVNSKAEKKVYINCFCNSAGDFTDWKTSLVEVEDGGSCYFRVTINLSTLRCEEFSTNGYA